MTCTPKHRPPVAPLWAALAACAAVTALPAAASAQLPSCGGDGTMLVSLLSLDGDDPGSVIEISDAQCQDDIPVRFRVTGITGDKDLWVFVGESCESPDRRDGGTTVAQCQEAINMDVQSQIEITLNVRTNLKCDQAISEKVWFLSLDGSADMNIGSYACVELPFDNDPPPTPASVADASGEREARLSWDPSDSAADYHVVWESTTASGDGCGGTPSFSAGDPVDLDSLDAYEGHATTNGTNYSLKPSQVNGGAAWFAVAAEDAAGNISPLSNVACARFVDAYSFTEVLEQRGGELQDGCSALPGRSGGPIGLLWLLSTAAALWLRRRRP